MKQVVIILSIFFFSTIVVSCKDKKENLNGAEISRLLSRGYWIPKEISWGGYSKNSKDTGDAFRVAFFYTLCFDSVNKFVLLASTQRHPRDYNDSIIFAGEPVVKAFKGVWSIVDTSLKVTYRVVPDGSTAYDSTENHEQMSIVNYSEGTFLLFKNKLYTQTDKYDKLSKNAIESYLKNN